MDVGDIFIGILFFVGDQQRPQAADPIVTSAGFEYLFLCDRS